MARSSALGSATRVEPGTSDDQTTAAELSRAVADATRLTIRLPDGRELDLPESLVRVLRASADELSTGKSVTLLASEVVLTPAEVGELLGLSRPFVARLLDQGLIASSHLPGSRHRTVRIEDVIAFQAMRERRREGRRRMAEIIEDAELPY
jgi:excisionase family DNA binding protein